MKVPVSIVVLTKNEEQDLPGCLEAAFRVTDDVLVLDSGSADRTREIAEAAGASFYEHHFSGFGDQRNWAIDHLPHRYPWVLHLDADERVTEAFESEVRTLLAAEPGEAGFYVPNKLMLGNQWLRFSSGYPVYQVRLFHRERLRFVNHGHGQREVTSGRLGYLREPYLHFAFSKGLNAWLHKHVDYASEEVLKWSQECTDWRETLWQCLQRDPIVRRRALKRVSFALPGRSLLRFIHQLIFKAGILDGRAGITYARMMAVFEGMIAANVSALKTGVSISRAWKRGH